MRTLAILILSSLMFMQTGKQFPELSGITLEDQEISIPNDVKGKYTFIGVAYSKKAESELNSWAEPLYFHFMPESQQSNTLFGNTVYDVNLYFIPMFSGAAQAIEGAARKKAVEHIDERLHSKVLFYKGSIRDYKKSLDMDDKSHPYFFLLDETGKIVYKTSGGYSDKKMIPIDNILDENLD